FLPNGKTGSPTNPIAGLTYSVVVHLTDAYFNVNKTVAPMPSVQLTVTDPNVNYGGWSGGSIQTLDSNASATFNAVLVTTGVWQFTATDQGLTYNSNTSTNVVVVPGAPTKLVVLLPNQSLRPGTLVGVSGAALQQTAGTPFTANVYATDQY